MRLMEETKELSRAIDVINRIIRRGSLVRIVDKNNIDFGYNLDREIDIIVAGFAKVTDDKRYEIYSDNRRYEYE